MELRNIRKLGLGTILALAVIAQGCASSRLQTPESGVPLMLTPLGTDAERMYVFPQELAEEKSVVVALINVDFSQSHILFDFSVGSFEPRAKQGSIYVKTVSAGETLVSLAEVRTKLQQHVEGQPVGIIMLLDGTPLGADEYEPKPEQRDFFRDFQTMMSEAGIAFAYIVPEKLVVSR